MNEDMIKSAYDAMSPDEAARQRMLKRLLDKGGQNVKKEYSAQPVKTSGWRGTLAAVLALVVVAVGMVTLLQRRTPSQLSDNQTLETNESTDLTQGEAIQDFMATPFYRAAMEYHDWSLAFSGSAPYWSEKPAEIAENYGLKSYSGDDRGTDSYDAFLENLSMASILREDVQGVVWDIESCWWYDEQRFNVAGSVTMAWEGSPRATPLDFNFYRTTPEYLLPACGEMGSLENYECWEYTLASGETAILARNAETAYVIVYRTEEVWFTVVDNWRRSEADRAMTREALEAFADLFTYEFVNDGVEETGIPDDANPDGQQNLLSEELDDNKICIAVQPTELISEGGAYLYIIPEDQATLLEYYTTANASAHTYTRWDSSNKRAGWWIVYQGQWWQVTESGAIFGTDRETRDGICIDADDAKELYEFCDAAVKKAGIGEPVRPEDITEIKSATLSWNGIHTVTDEYALNKIESWFSNSRESSSVACWFTAQLTLELENGETKIITMATDECAYYMSEGVAYGYGEITDEGIDGNEEFYSLFAPAVIYEKSKEGMDAVKEYLCYMNWSRYANEYGADETFALIDMIETWATEEPTFNCFGGAIGWSTGLDGVYADYYAGMLARLYKLAPSEFAWACLGNATDEQKERTLSMLAYHWNITVEEVCAKLTADISQN